MRYLLIVLTLFTALTVNAQTLPEDKIAAAMDADVHRLLIENWTLHMLDESAWEAQRKAYHFDGQAAFTILKEHATYVRIQFVNDASEKSLRFVLAHEAGHRDCTCNSEKIANIFASEHRTTP